jgi:hypothetical protein
MPNTNAEYRTRVHASIRTAVEEHTGRTADRALVRAVADSVLPFQEKQEAGRRAAILTGLQAYDSTLFDPDLATAVNSAVIRLDVRPDFPLIQGLPDAPAITWMDYDHGDHIALRYGHPGNGIWRYNGVGYSAADLLTIIGTFTAHPLDYRANPQTTPSETF